MPSATTTYNFGNTDNRWNNIYGRYGNFVNSTSATGVNVTNSYAYSTTQGLKSINNGATGTGYGLYGSAESSSASYNYGVYGIAKNSNVQNYGLYGKATGPNSTNSTNHGVLATASGSGSSTGGATNYGASATSSGNGYSTSYKNTNYGVYAAASGNYAYNYAVRAAASGTNSTNYGIYASGSTYAGYFDGAVYVKGSITYTGSCTSSDERLKKNVQQLGGALDKVLKLRGVSYYWKNADELKAMPNTMEDDSTLHYEFNDKKQIGVIAQEIETILPELVSTDNNGYKAVDYSKLTPVLIEAMKEQQAIIESQQKEIDELKAQMREILEKLK